jgi:phosphoribosyl-ATP pyrophosphohydrolase/phosphoribosyl-AMP cyclohydrolase
MAQKVGEEGVEVALAAVTRDDKELIGESADLLFHLTLLLKSRNLKLAQVVDELAKRHAAKV